MMKRTTLFVAGMGDMDVAVADTFFLRLRGLLGRDVNEIGGLVISPCNQVHTCFMDYPIDIVYLDAAGRALRVDESVPPWRFCKAQRGAAYVLELPAHRVGEGVVAPRRSA